MLGHSEAKLLRLDGSLLGNLREAFGGPALKTPFFGLHSCWRVEIQLADLAGMEGSKGVQ